jgi:hypothetical protein
VIVVDLGCANHDNIVPSLERLVEMFQPEFIFGFDPSPRLDANVKEVAGVPCQLEQKAAWLWDGEVGYHDDNTGSHIGGARGVPCLDFSKWLLALGERVTVKMDIEGAEWALLTQLKVTGADSLIDKMLVEWHKPLFDNEFGFSCPVETWEW